ncbi:unnamed protein product [Brachionus calyciflorus]|uniref:SecA DEAD-like N-terminal domain-containing protein n=1 Tax=Brachionus calyciflorus TaxID=104777 RepID=A0A813MA29_9BILA|nr:unnamed protein product [Brachionus calyciflorus]
MAELLHQMIPKIEDHLKSVAYIYTKFPSVESITHALNEALNKDDLNETISEIIESMLEETPILIDPLNPETAKKALKKIVKLTRIEYPNEIFKNITNSKAYDCLIEQVNLHERTIDCALVKENFDLITFKLSQLSKLKCYLNIDCVCDRLFAKLDKYFNELYKTCWYKITNWFEDSMNILSQDQIDEIKNSIQKFQLAKNLISIHLDSKFDYVLNLHKEIIGQCDRLFNRFQKCSCENLQEVIRYLENIKIICSCFSNKELDELFLKTREEVGKKFKTKTDSIQKLLLDKVFDFEQLADILMECKRLKKLYLKSLETRDELDIENKFKRACSFIKEYFESQKEEIIKKLEEIGAHDEKKSIESLFVLVENLNKSKECAKLCILIDKEDLISIIKSINVFVFNKISAICMTLECILSQSEVNKTLMDTIESNYNEIKKWRVIGDAANSTSDSFHKIKARIIEFFVDLNKKLLEDSFDSFRNTTTHKVNYESIKLYFQIMKNAEWLDELKENFYFELYIKFENDLLKRAKDLSRSYTQFNISIENYRNIKDANQIYLNLVRFEPLADTNDEFQALVENVENNFKQKMEEAISVIKKEINEENLTKEKLKCSFLDYAIKFIDEATSNSISVINLNELEVLKHSIKELLISYNNSVSVEFEENFRSIKDSKFDDNLEKTISEKSEKMISRLKEFELNLFIRKFDSLKSFVRMIKKNDYDDLEKIFQNIEDFFICSSIFLDNSFRDIFKDDSKREIVKIELKELQEFCKNNRLEFVDGLNQTCINQVIKCLQVSLKCDLIAKISQNKLQKSNFEFDLIDCTPSLLIKALNENVELIVSEILNTNFMDIEKIRYEKDRINMHTNINSKLKFLKELNRSIELKEILESFKIFNKWDEFVKKIVDFLNKSVTNICEKILKILESTKFTESQLKELRLNYENLITLDNVYKDDLSSNSCLKEIQTQLLNKYIEAFIEDSLKKFRQKHSALEILNLASALEDEETGLLILRDYQIFKGEMIRNRVEKTASHDIKYVLENLRGDAVSKDQLEKRYNDFDTEYHALVKRNISSISNTKTLDKLINETKKILNINNKRKIFGTDIKNKIPKLVAHIFALWTLKNTKYYNEMKEVPNKDAYLLKPHPAQVIAIFRLLGVGTGEGKSVILAVVAIVLALAGFDVSCACYSQYLSERDYNDFKEIFHALNVEKYVFYGTFNQVCENFLNQNYDIRERVLSLIKSNTLSTEEFENKNARPKILLIDEVDVFFNQDFLGNLYVPSARLRDPSITKLINLIWTEKKSINFLSLKKTSEYKEVKEKFSKWISLIDEALKDVLADLKSYESHEYKVFDDRIAYKEQDGVQTNIFYGYKTLFAYYHENERDYISKKSLHDNISLLINCGCFSYCEIPIKFQYILGVTGTLENLSLTQKSIISEMYKIKFSTYIPSIYGERKLVFRNEADTLVATKVDYFLRFKDEIDKRILGTVNVDVKRAVLVFFDKIEILNSFYASPQMEAYKVNDDVNILKKDVTLNDKIYLIKKAIFRK